MVIFWLIKGIYNVSLGKKVYISEIIHALNKKKKDDRFYPLKATSNDNFVLNNKKLLRMINLKINKKNLLDYCYNM